MSIILDQFGQPFSTGQGIDATGLNPATLCRHAYFGSHGFRDGMYLVSHKRETSFDERRRYSSYVNYFDRVVNALSKPIFNEAPQRTEDAINPYWDDNGQRGFVHDCNRAGASLTRFLANALLYGKMQGVTFLVMDNFSAEAHSLARSQQAALEARVYPYLYRRSVETVHSAGANDAGALAWIVFRENDGTDERGNRRYVYRRWDAFGWQVFEDPKLEKLRAGGEHGLGVIPVIPVALGKVDEEEDPLIPSPPLYGIARTNWELFNVSSELREVERKQGFSVLVMPKAVAAGQDKTKTVGTSNALTFDSEAKHAPHFISPDAEIPRILMEHRADLIRTMFEQASLAGVVGVQKAQSGLAKEWDFQATREALKDTSQAMEEVEYKIADLFERYTARPVKLSVKYTENYGVEDLMGEAEKTRLVLDLELGPKANAEVKKDYFLRWVKGKDHVTQEVIDSVIDDIDARSDDAMHSSAGDRDRALVGASGGGEEDNAEE